MIKKGTCRKTGSLFCILFQQTSERLYTRRFPVSVFLYQNMETPVTAHFRGAQHICGMDHGAVSPKNKAVPLAG